EARAGVASQVIGFLGEEGAAKLARSESFAQRFLKGRKGAKLESVTRHLEYGAKGSLDLVGLSDRAELVFGEVKHYGADTWANSANRKKVLEQLTDHNAGIPGITKRLNRRQGDVAARVLFVSENGFKNGLTPSELREFTSKVTSLGWEL